VVSWAVVVVTGVPATGNRDLAGVDIGDSEDRAFWKDCGPVRLVISHHHRRRPARSFGASWPRCRVHFLRHALVKVPGPRPRWRRAVWG
jgi:putative transposase